MGSLGSAVDEVFVVDLRGLSGPGLGEHIVELHRQCNRLTGAYLAALEVFDRTGGALASHGLTAAWVRAQLHVSPGPASRDVHLARDLADVLPATRAALADGDLSAEHAQVIASLKTAVSPDALSAAEPHLVGWAAKVTPKELRAVATHVRQSYAPDRLTRDETEDWEARRLDVATTIAGMGVGSFTLHPHGHETLMTAIHAASRPVAGDTRTPKQRRADALITIAEIALRSGDLPVTGQVKPHVTLIHTLSGLTGTDQTGQAGAAQTGAGEVRAGECGFGATLGPEWVKRVTCDAEISRIVFGPRGEVLDAGRATRVFTAAQVRAIVARDRHCMARLRRPRRLVRHPPPAPLGRRWADQRHQRRTRLRPTPRPHPHPRPRHHHRPHRPPHHRPPPQKRPHWRGHDRAGPRSGSG